MRNLLIARIWKVGASNSVLESPVSSLLIDECWDGLPTPRQTQRMRIRIHSHAEFPLPVAKRGGGEVAESDVPTKPLKHSICAWKGTWHPHGRVCVSVCGQPHRPNFTSFPPTNRGTCQHFVVISVSAVASSSPPPIRPCVHPFAACVSVCLLILLSSLHSHLTAVNIRFTCDWIILELAKGNNILACIQCIK